MTGLPLLSARDGLDRILEENARAHPGKTAIVHPVGRATRGSTAYAELTYAQLQARIELLADRLNGIGIAHGTRTVLMAPPGPDLYALLFALFRLGAVPVVVDPGMGIRRMLHCFRSVEAEAFIGPPAAHLARALAPAAFRHVRIAVALGRRRVGRTVALEGLPDTHPAASKAVQGDDLLMIGFTTGSTGPAKGVEYTHRMGAAMARAVRGVHARSHDDVSLVTLPLYGMLDLLYGSTLVLAPVPPTKVGRADPELIVDALTRHRVSTLFASPALLEPLGDHLARHPVPLPDLRCVVSGGAPVAPRIVSTLREVLDPRARIHVTYGATEALPITSIESAEILRETATLAAAGAGTCVGHPVNGTEVRTIRVENGPVPRWNPSLCVPVGTVGEIVVAGDPVSSRYHRAPAADLTHKIRQDEAGRTWHRTGDLGYFDSRGRLWFCGRKTDRVLLRTTVLDAVRCEGVFDRHPLVRRSALVAVGARGHRRPVLCVETEEGVHRSEWDGLAAELAATAAAHPPLDNISSILRHPGFPVDIRHNAKIDRPALAQWAVRALAARRGRLLRLVPLAGWAYLVVGLLHPFDHPVPVTLWWADAFLSTVGHAAQIFRARPRARAAGYGTAATMGLTLLYGATWWRFLPEPGGRA